ncbi:MAG: DUF2911 domain-containing protein [Gemmatimonadales bacterium]
MRTTVSLLGALACGALSLAAQGAPVTGAFVTRLGADTLALEEYTRTATKLEGQQVLRVGRSVHRIYTATFRPDGSLERFELVTHNISGAPGPAETKATVEFVGDSAIVRVPRGDSIATFRMAVAKGAFPFVIYTYALVEHFAERARAAGGDSVALQAVVLGQQQPWAVAARRLAPDSLSFMFGQVGPWTVKLDRTGRLTHLSGKGSTIQVEVDRVPSVDLSSAGPAFAGRSLGTLSVRDTARAAIAGADIWVDYGRPLKRGRAIFGNVVPWNAVWRTGANAATQFSTPVDLVMGGVTIPAGKYTLWSLPSPTGWKLIVNKQTGQWGTEYHPEQDLAWVNLWEEKLPQPLEQFTITLEPEGTGGVIRFAWDDRRVSIPFTKR